MRERISAMVLVVPARDEEALLGGCLRHLQAAMDHLGLERPEILLRLTVVLDGCRDGSAAVAAAFTDKDPRIEVLAVDFASVGAARAAGIAHAMAGARGAGGRHLPEGTWIACTDADTRVPPHWLTGQLELADRGADAVVGTVEPDKEELDAALHRLWQLAHVPSEGHGHVHGANLGVRASTYGSVGGFDPVPEHEDVLLVQKLRDAGASIRATARIHAVTSGRRRGRVPAGFAGYLRGLAPDIPADTANSTRGRKPT